MGGYTTNSTYAAGKSEYIYTYRSGSGAQTPPIGENSCDKRITAYDPFDFTVDYKAKYVKVRKPVLKNGKPVIKRNGKPLYNYTRVIVPYPHYNSVKKTRTVTEWRFVLKAGKSAISKSQAETPHISKMIEWLEKILQREGPCRPVQPRSPSIQHNCTHWKSEISGLPPITQIPGIINPAYTVPLITNDKYGYRAVEYPYESYVGASNEGTDTYFGPPMAYATHTLPVGELEKSTTVETLTAMLWPSSDDFASSQASPFIDLAEAASDGVFPLGPPPSAEEAHSRMVENCMSDKQLGVVKEVVDFASNSWLWATLVFDPVIQSGIALSTSVEANDMAIEQYSNIASKGKWIKGKSLRLYGRDPETAATNHGAFLTHTAQVGGPLGGNTQYGVLTHNVKYDKFMANAMLVYKLSIPAANSMNSSAMRLGQFFNRLSTSMETVFHNIVPLSFVYDWFTSEYTGVLNLKDKVYMPLDDWKLITSYSLDYKINSTWTHDRYAGNDKKVIARVRIPYVYSSWWTYYISTASYDVRPTYATGEYIWKTSLDVWRIIYANHLREPYDGNIQEEHSYYRRWVYNRPARRTNFDNHQIGIFGFDTSKEDPLDSIGKQVTLGSLIWGQLSS